MRQVIEAVALSGGVRLRAGGTNTQGQVSVETQKWQVLMCGWRMEKCEQDSPGQSFATVCQLESP